jgi:hypothetical protein
VDKSLRRFLQEKGCCLSSNLSAPLKGNQWCSDKNLIPPTPPLAFCRAGDLPFPPPNPTMPGPPPSVQPTTPPNTL